MSIFLVLNSILCKRSLQTLVGNKGLSQASNARSATCGCVKIALVGLAGTSIPRTGPTLASDWTNQTASWSEKPSV